MRKTLLLACLLAGTAAAELPRTINLLRGARELGRARCARRVRERLVRRSEATSRAR